MNHMLKKISLISFLLLTFFYEANSIVELDFGNTKFIAAVLETEDGIEVWLNTRKHWVDKKSLISGYDEDDLVEVENVINQVNLCNLAESQYEPCSGNRTSKEIKFQLMQVGVEIDSSFQAWAKTQIN